MRLPRHDTLLRLPVSSPRDALTADEALLEAAQAGVRDPAALTRWWVAARPALVVGLGLRARLAQVVDLEACARGGIEVLTRRAGGGAVLVDQHMICGAICVPLPDGRVGTDLTASYRWLGEALLADLPRWGVMVAARVEVPAARADVAALRARVPEPLAQLVLDTCYGTLS